MVLINTKKIQFESLKTNFKFKFFHHNFRFITYTLSKYNVNKKRNIWKSIGNKRIKSQQYFFKTIILDKQFYTFLKTQFRYNKFTKLVIIFILVRTQTHIDICYGSDINLCQDFTQNRNFIISFIYNNNSKTDKTICSSGGATSRIFYKFF